MTKAFIKKNSLKLKAIDTNFKELGYQDFEGIPILSILKHYSKKGVREVTLIANDQYVTFDEKDYMEKKTLLQTSKKNKVFKKLGSFLKNTFSQKIKKGSTPQKSRQDVLIEEMERVGMMSCLTMNLN